MVESHYSKLRTAPSPTKFTACYECYTILQYSKPSTHTSDIESWESTDTDLAITCVLLCSYTAVDMAVSKSFPCRLVHSTCISSAPALEMHSAQILEMLVQMQCPRNVQVLQEMFRIQEQL